MEHPDEFFSSHWKEMYSSSSTQAVQLPWLLDHVEGWHHLVLTFFVPPGHVGPYKFASGVTLPGLSPSQAHDMAEKQRKKGEEEDTLKKSLGDARKRLNEANQALSEMNKEIMSTHAMWAQVQEAVRQVWEKGKNRKAEVVAQIVERDAAVRSRDDVSGEVDALAGRLENLTAPEGVTGDGEPMQVDEPARTSDPSVPGPSHRSRAATVVPHTHSQGK